MTNLTLPTKAYEYAKWFTLIFLPALSALIFSLGQLNDWSWAANVVGTLAIIGVFLGTILGISTKNYNNSDAPFDGRVVVESDPASGKTVYALELNDDPDVIPGMDKLTLKIVGADAR